MSSSRTRPEPPAAEDSPPGEASVAPWAPAQSLAELKEAMGSPEAIQAEVDALLTAMARPLSGDETPRARADLLLSLMDLPAEARDRKGSDGRTVRAAAVETLMALGYPYALEVPPDVLEDVRRQAGNGRRGMKGWRSWVGGGATVLSLLTQVFLMTLLLRTDDTWDSFHVTLMVLVVGPPVLALLGRLAGSRSVQSLGAWGMAAQGLAWLLFCGIQTRQFHAADMAVLLAVIPWYLPLAAAYLMHPKTEPR